jgi:transposase-like protein
MNNKCPNLHCNYHQKSQTIIKDGFFYRTSDSRKIQRFKCKSCLTKFSNATYSVAKYQKKRRANHLVFKFISSGVSIRRVGKILNLHQDTVSKKVKFLAFISRRKQEKLLLKLNNKVTHMQVDDLITIEHTKLKPVSVSVAVDVHSRVILGAEVSQIAAFGHLSELSKRKYGPRKSELKNGLDRLFKSISACIQKDSLVESDEHKMYPGFIHRYLNKAEHKQYKGGKGCVAGQGELKKLAHDPLFIINHTLAMFRANINRLIRKTWCTTKKLDMLKDHLDIFIWYYNSELLSGEPHFNGAV